jgi:transposase-like protein
MGEWRPNIVGYTEDRRPIVYLVPLNSPVEKFHYIAACKFCGSTNTVKYGTYRGVQRYWCKVCQRKFADNDALPGMRVPPDQIGAALSAFYGGASIGAIRRQLEQVYGLYPSKSTVYRWIVRYSKKAANVMDDFAARTGGIWVADETVLKVGGENFWFWDVLDSDTRMLLASQRYRQ